MDHNKLRFLNILFFVFLSFFCVIFPSPVYSDCQSLCAPANCGETRCNTCSFCSLAGSQSLGQFEGLGPLGTIIRRITNPRDIGEPINFLNKVISITVGFITLIAFVYFVFLFFTAALSWVTAGGDQKKVENAGKQITNGIIGMIVVVSAIFLIDLLGKVLGINILNPFSFIVDIWR